MNDSEKLRLLADWFDMRDKGKIEDNTVQCDLRDLAKKIDSWGGYLPFKPRPIPKTTPESPVKPSGPRKEEDPTGIFSRYDEEYR